MLKVNLGTFDELNILNDKFDEGGTIGVKDAVDQEDACEGVNLEGTTEDIDKKYSSEDVILDGTTEVKDAIVDITTVGTTYYIVSV
ncbi:unnamed protein product [Vicia faba]|uniref:Uncharacterized protein n=1 Tax=Vicia faba TaxID=3906 RepID=A0AAV0ZGQ1_VICFA|nr:unnamed protein product [Vicia faba]